MVKRYKLKKKIDSSFKFWTGTISPVKPCAHLPHALSSQCHMYSGISHTTVYWPFVCLVHESIKFLKGMDCMCAAGLTRGLMKVCWCEVVSPSASLFSLFLLKPFPSKLLADKNRNVGSMLFSSVSQTLNFGSRILLTPTLEKAVFSGFTTLRSSNPKLTQH